MATSVEPKEVEAGGPRAQLGPLAETYHTRWAGLTGEWRRRPGTRLGTLGPAGTSSDVTARHLAEGHDLRIVLRTGFDDVLRDLLAGDVDVALVPSAYRGISTFHWHPDVVLRAFFPLSTPDYGIALPDAAGGPPPGDGPVRVAAMWEVRRVYEEVRPEALRDRPVTWVDASSTQHAAALLGRGMAELAVTNLPGIRAHDLQWLVRRPGAEILWALFARGATPTSPATHGTERN